MFGPYSDLQSPVRLGRQPANGTGAPGGVLPHHGSSPFCCSGLVDLQQVAVLASVVARLNEVLNFWADPICLVNFFEAASCERNARGEKKKSLA